MTIQRWAGATLAVLLTLTPALAVAAPFTLSANGMADDALLPKSGAFDKPGRNGVPCGGENRAPGFTWINAPAKAQSFAILETDPDGAGGAGVSHWVLYNIPANVTSISGDEIAAGKYTPGRGTGDLVGYRGPCPPAGDAAHHYIVTLYALDIPPGLPANLDRAGVLAAMAGHTLGATTTIMRFQPPPS